MSCSLIPIWWLEEKKGLFCEMNSTSLKHLVVKDKAIALENCYYIYCLLFPESRWYQAFTQASGWVSVCACACAHVLMFRTLWVLRILMTGVLSFPWVSPSADFPVEPTSTFLLAVLFSPSICVRAFFLSLEVAGHFTALCSIKYK